MSPLFGSKPRKKLTRMFYATDIHGSERTYRKFINAGKFYDVNVIVMGGDITGKLLIPIIKGQNGHYRAMIQDRLEQFSTEEELKGLIDRLSLLGFYYKVMEEDEYQVLSQDPEKVDQLFHQLARGRLADWVELAETRLAGTGIRCFATGGNDDDPEVLTALDQVSAEAFIACEGDVVYIDDDHTMVSVGFSTPTPWDTPREMEDEELGEFIEKMVAGVPDMSHTIFNFHDPPVDSTLDTCPMLDWNTDPPEPIMQAGQQVMYGAGSRSVRNAIEKYQPMLGLHGHIHESQGVATIGRTTCINPGSEYGEGILRGCIVTFADGEVEGYQMTSG
jgi:Icc-related predicted phosphoesterase